MSRWRFLLSVFAALYIGVLVGLTFVRTSEQVQQSGLLPLAAFFVLGVTLLLLMGPRRWWVAVGFGVLGSAWIEAAQTVWMPPGYASLEHLLWASLGLILGVCTASLLIALARPASPSHEPHRIVAQGGSREIP